MNVRRTAELERLLSESLNSLEIWHGEAKQLGTAEFKKILQKCRSVYDPALSPWIHSYRPEISMTDIKNKLLHFVNQELAEHIRNGKIHSATLAFAGDPNSGSDVEDVLRNLLVRTVVDGPAAAAQAFSDCKANTSCIYYQFLLITGVRIPEPVEIFEGITLIPLPESRDSLPPHLPISLAFALRHQSISLDDLLGKTLVRVEYEVTPIFHKPAQSYSLQFGPEQHFVTKLRGSEVPDPDLDNLCNALAVVARCRVQPVMTWATLLDYELFNLDSMWGISASACSWDDSDSLQEEAVQLSRPQIDTIKSIYMGLTEVPTQTWERLRIPIDRWAKSMLEGKPIDKIVDLGIALECLYVPDAQGEVRYRFSLHAAVHLGKNKEERQQLLEEFKGIYDARSDVVHTGRLRGMRGKPTFDESKFVSRVQELCWLGITSVIDAGEIPNWEDLVLGEEHT